MIEAGRHLDDDQCASLALGLLPPSEHANAVAHARECIGCETRLRAHVGADVRARVDLMTAAGPLRVVTLRRARPVGRIVAAIAATAAAAAVIAILVTSTPSPHSGTAPEWLTTPGELVLTRSDAPIDDAFRTGLEAYGRHDLGAAINALRIAKVSGGAEQARRLYLGHALLATGNALEARDWLESLKLETLPDPWRIEARRSLAAAWRQTGRTRQADSIESALAR